MKVFKPDFSDLARFLDALPYRGGWPGSDCLVLWHGEPVFRHQTGFSDLDARKPMTGRERVNLYSCSKIATCVAAMQLFEKGLFKLDDPLADYMPEFSDMKVREADGSTRPASEPIRIWHLFTMTAGFSYDLNSPSLAAFRAANPACPTREFVRALAGDPLHFDPGTRWNYSLCHDVLAALVEVLSGRLFAEYARDNLFAPLGMADTTFLLPDSELGAIAPQYRWNAEAGKPVSCGPAIQPYKVGAQYASGGAGCVSTCDDYVKLLEALRVGDVILKKETIDLMATDRLTDATRPTFWNREYGYGLGVRCKSAILPDGWRDFGWGGAAGSLSVIDREHGFTIMLVQHMLGAPDPALRWEVVRLVREAVSAPRRQRHFLDMTWWDPYVETIADEATYLRRKFRQDVTDKTTGLSQDALHGRLAEIVAAGKAAGEDWRVTKANCFAAEANEESIDVSPLDWFPAIAIWDRLDLPIAKVCKRGRAAEINAARLPDWVKKEWAAGNADGSWNMWQDFDHSVPDWRVILPLGFPGLKTRLEKIAVAGAPFYESCAIAADAILAGIDRFIVQGKMRMGKLSTAIDEEKNRHRCERLAKEVACLERLRAGAPQTAYDVMMFVWLYFMFSEHLDGIQCRSLTELDVFLTPYYDADIAAGRTTEAEFREQLKHFLWQWGSIANYWNQPVGLGGTKPDGTTEFNHVSKIILDVMDECALTTPKFLVKVAPNTPDWALDKMLDMARRHRSIAFIGEEPTARALKRWVGASDRDCREMVVRGCYEFGLRDGCNTTGLGHVNFLKVVEKMLAEAKRRRDDGGVVATSDAGTFQPFNFSTFQLFKAEYLRRLADTTDLCRRIAYEFEKVLSDVNPACLMTLATEHALKTRRDGFATGCPRGNNTTILSVGLGTAVDALLAVKELVFEKKELTLAQLGAIMASNWEGHEALRLRMLRSRRKWGNNDPEANALGAELIATFAGEVNGRPNSRGGAFFASGHCARQFIVLGEKTGATPDGRRAGEEMSKNLSPTMGVDTEGATALVETLAASSVETLPGDYPLDMMLHPSVCAGDKGLAVMKTLVRRFHRNGGSVIQFTVFSPEELRDAQAHPEKYENLQVRVCGWNVRWNDLARAEQDAYIRRAENVAQG
ncbi:MAG: serine hydrolase [Kiritimatiellae bacterium]|nr:serine hydrolase [Kiritimatiellia bacterium]